VSTLIDHPKETTMKFTKSIATGLFVASLFAVAGCASTPTKEGTGEYIDDIGHYHQSQGVIFNEPLKSKSTLKPSKAWFS
jgi:hypothetical protein